MIRGDESRKTAFFVVMDLELEGADRGLDGRIGFIRSSVLEHF
jgi:hypothetical protein